MLQPTLWRSFIGNFNERILTKFQPYVASCLRWHQSALTPSPLLHLPCVMSRWLKKKKITRRERKNAIFRLKRRISKDCMQLIHFLFLCILEVPCCCEGRWMTNVLEVGEHSRSKLQYFFAHKEGKCLESRNIWKIFLVFLCIFFRQPRQWRWANMCVCVCATPAKGFLSYTFVYRRGGFKSLSVSSLCVLRLEIMHGGKFSFYFYSAERWLGEGGRMENQKESHENSSGPEAT